MMKMLRVYSLFLMMGIFFSFTMSGCAVNFYKQSPKSKTQIKELQAKVDELEALRQKEKEQFEQTMDMLAKKLSSQISDRQVSLKMDNGSLIIVLSDNILFDSGKAVLKDDAKPVLNKVSEIIQSEVPNKNIGINGHTDNVPITYSKWKSNWELSSARATNVLYYMEETGLSPARLSATGYGEYRPAASNDTKEGRSMNRRVEIAILPEYQEERVSGDSIPTAELIK
ncbi:MAG: OmpA family protein [Candidatus Omnitrophica bacterium]|nr:OmpA family protein [Candidatus Omnitrophota bacterium]